MNATGTPQPGYLLQLLVDRGCSIRDGRRIAVSLPLLVLDVAKVDDDGRQDEDEVAYMLSQRFRSLGQIGPNLPTTRPIAPSVRLKTLLNVPTITSKTVWKAVMMVFTTAVIAPWITWKMEVITLPIPLIRSDMAGGREDVEY